MKNEVKADTQTYSNNLWIKDTKEEKTVSSTAERQKNKHQAPTSDQTESLVFPSLPVPRPLSLV